MRNIHNPSQAEILDCNINGTFYTIKSKESIEVKEDDFKPLMEKYGFLVEVEDVTPIFSPVPVEEKKEDAVVIPPILEKKEEVLADHPKQEEVLSPVEISAENKVEEFAGLDIPEILEEPKDELLEAEKSKKTHKKRVSKK